MKIILHQLDIRLKDLRTRMPFKYGIATMTRMPMLFLRLEGDWGGKRISGIAADLLPPRWFTKNPDQPVDEEIRQMLRVIERSAASASGMSGETVYDLWRSLYAAQDQWGQEQNLPALLAHFGTSLVERALIEAVARVMAKPFSALVRDNDLGIRLSEIHPELGSDPPRRWLPQEPLQRINVRHTVGLADPLTDSEIPREDRVDDGLPQSLEACIRRYGLRHFKVKVCGVVDRDLERLERVADVVQTHAGDDCRFSLDGNEQFSSLAQLRELWERVHHSQTLRRFFERLLFVEQPLHRDRALQPEVADEFRQWPGHPPVIIDESDGSIESLPRALELGYSGTSHKNCKGVIKGIANRCLLQALNHRAPREEPRLMSGEDLCNIGPVALLQDLSAMATLGISSVERNGHHYCAGLSLFSDTVQQMVLQHHSDLYEVSPMGWPTLLIRDGAIEVSSVNASPFGVGFEMDLRDLTPAAEYQPPVETPG